MKISSINKITLNVGVALYFSSFSNAAHFEGETWVEDSPLRCAAIETETVLDFGNTNATSTLEEGEIGELRFHNVGYHREGDHEISFDMVVRQAPGTPYTSGNLTQNGKDDYYGKINVESNQGEGTFDFCFENPDNHERITLEAFFFSFYDIDGMDNRNGNGFETISLQRDVFVDAFLTGTTEIIPAENSGLVEYMASTAGNAVRQKCHVL